MKTLFPVLHYLSTRVTVSIAGQVHLPDIVLRADIKPIVDGEAARRAASPSISVLTYLRTAIQKETSRDP